MEHAASVKFLASSDAAGTANAAPHAGCMDRLAELAHAWGVGQWNPDPNSPAGGIHWLIDEVNRLRKLRDALGEAGWTEKSMADSTLAQPRRGPGRPRKVTGTDSTNAATDLDSALRARAQKWLNSRQLDAADSEDSAEHVSAAPSSITRRIGRRPGRQYSTVKKIPCPLCDGPRHRKDRPPQETQEECAWQQWCNQTLGPGSVTEHTPAHQATFDAWLKAHPRLWAGATDSERAIRNNLKGRRIDIPPL